MHPFRASVIREIRRYGHDRLLVIVTVLIPIFMAMGYIAMFAKGNVHDLPIAVVDADNTPTSRQLVNMLRSSPTLLLDLNTTNIDQAQKEMAKGNINAIVNIPPGLESNILSGEQAQVAAFIDATYITKSSLILRDITTVFQAFNIGVETKILTSKGTPQANSYAMAYPIVMEKHILFNPFGSYSYYLLPGLMPLILIVVVIITTVYVIGSELRYSTAPQWLETAGGNVTRAMVAKLSPYFVIFILLTLFFNTILYRFMGLPFRADDIFYLVMASILNILAYMSLGIIFLAITSSMRFAMSLGAAVSIASFSFAGLTFPHVAMYPIVAWAAKFIPFTYYINIFVEQSMRGADGAMALRDLGCLGLFVIAMIPFIPLLKKRCLNPKFYGRL